MSKWYVTIRDRVHTTRTNITDCKTECGLRLVAGMDLMSVAPTGEKCQACAQSTAFTGLGQMSLPHYLEKQNEALREIIEETAISMEAHDLSKSAKLLRKKLKEAIDAFAH